MRIVAIAFALALLSASVAAQDWLTKLKAVQARMPADVAAFMDRRIGCDHWTGEEPYDADRLKQINDAVTELCCASLRSDETALRAKYAANAEAMAAIDLAKDGGS
jgi:hypothetical protein